MTLPLDAPIRPMLAKRLDALPAGDDWIFEPKWDGFRALVFRDGGDIELQSRDLKPFNRYFPELVAPLSAQLPPRCVLDGEIVIQGERGLDFEALLIRIHPAESRVALLAEQSPASFVAWDLLCVGDEDLSKTAFAGRRARLEQVLADARAPLYVTPITRDRATAQDWFERFEGAGLDGVMAKAADGVYEPGKRTQFKVKHKRTADCVVGGFRWHKGGQAAGVGSLLLGLHDPGGTLHHVGVAASFSAARRLELVDELAPLRDGAECDHPWQGWMEAMSGQRMPGSSSRWNRGKDLGWEPLRPERVVEVSYDHMQGRRFRHTAHFVRWRPDKPPGDCDYAQLEVVPPLELERIFALRAEG